MPVAAAAALYILYIEQYDSLSKKRESRLARVLLIVLAELNAVFCQLISRNSEFVVFYKIFMCVKLFAHLRYIMYVISLYLRLCESRALYTVEIVEWVGLLHFLTEIMTENIFKAYVSWFLKK